MIFPFTSTHLVTLFLFSMSFLTHTVLPYMFTGFQIRDLEGTGTNFISDAASWHTTAQSAANIYTTDCGVYLLGGWNVLGSAGVSSGNQYFYRTYTNLPAHTMIRYSFTFYALDTWDISTNDGFRLAFDTGVVDGWHLDYSTFQPNLCGGSNAKDLANVRVFGTVTHSATSLTFKVISAFDEPPNNESFGFRDLILLFSQGPVTTETQCARQAAGITVPKQCTCAEGSYYSTSCVTCNGNCASCFGSGTGNCFACKIGGYGWDGFNCIACNSYCYDCYGPAATQCNSCQSGYAYYAETTTCLEDCPFPLTKTAATGGTYICTSPCAAGSFVYWDKSCSTTCAAPLVQKTLTIGTVKLCTYPCTSNEYLYWDGSCKPNCGFPLQTTIISGMKLCTYKCTATQYLDWNNACVTTCNYPLVRRVVIDKNICTSPCYRSTDFIYWNQECSSACIAPLKQRTASGLQYCDYPCLLNSQYLYWNGSCIDSCSSPLKVRFERGKKFCDYPGDTANYLYWDGTDSPTCPSPPLTQKTEGTSPVLKFCVYGCNDWEFLYWNGTCATTCKFPLQKRIQNGKQFCDYGTCTGTDALFWDESCRDVSTCTAPLIPRSEGGKQFCDFPVGNISNFLYWDGTFSAVCPEPLTQRIDGTTIIRKFCDYKCNNPLEYLAFNGQCLSTCDAPHIARTQSSKLFCNFACGAQYLFHNGTCRDSCPPPYVTRVDGLGKYCDHPCTTVTDSYYWNGVCDSTCPSPLNQITIETTKWCIYPCSANQFLAPNGVCLDACDFPFTKTKVSDMKYCSSSCSTNEYLYWGDGTCISSCESPLRKSTTDIGNTCKSPCETQEEYYDESSGLCLKTCDTTSVSVNGLYLLCLMDRSDTSSFLDIILEAPSNSTLSLVVLTKLTTHVQYLDMDTPTRVQKLAAGKGRSILSLRFGSSMSGEMEESFQKYDIPDIFLDRGAHSNFIVNFWEEMTSWCIVIVAIAVFLFIEVICKARDWSAGQEVCEKIVMILKWNVMIILIATSLGDILLYTSFELRTLYASSSFTSISREICLVMVSIGIALLIGTYLLAIRYKSVKEAGPPHKVSEFLETWKGYQAVYNGYKRPLFYLVYLLRIILCSIITAFLFFTPFFQTLFHMLISVIMVSYIAYSRPIASKLNYIQLLITEVLVLVINISLFALAILLRSNRQNSSLGVMFGDLVVGCNSCINILFIVVLAIKIIDAIRTVCVYQGAQRKHDSSAWVQILAVIPSQCGFGFEEISVNTLNKPIQAREKPPRQQTLVTETSQLIGSKSPEPDEPGMSIQLTSQVDRETLNTWEGNREKEMRVDSVFDKGIKEDRGEEKDIMTTSRFGSDTKRTKAIPPLDLKLWERMERGIREGYEDQEE